jgi:hypothetical protein
MSSLLRQANRTSYIKAFPSSTSNSVSWVYKSIMDPSNNLQKFITPSTNNSVYLPKDLIVHGSITSISDRSLKENINDLENELGNKILKINPKSYNLINDEQKKQHFGVIAQELEEFFPELIINTVIDYNIENNIEKKEIKTVNYLELIPIMILKIQNMQKEIDESKQKQIN